MASEPTAGPASRRHQRVRVRLRRSSLTTNDVGTQFGGSLFAMTDALWMVMVMRDAARPTADG